MSMRKFGKAAFITLADATGQMQVYVRKDSVGDEQFSGFKKYDIGDIVGAGGHLFKTKTGEPSIHADAITMVSKSLRPMPEKWHGLSNIETRYRQRYLDLLVNPEVKETFYRRTKIMSLIRSFLQEKDFVEVETPMMQPVPGGATARPFKTHHNTYKLDLYLRISPELYLKRLLVGGIERVFEINRNFRNEGVSTRHNPEFTMVEFYWAYATYEDLMDLTETMLRELALELYGETSVTFEGREIDYGPAFQRMSIRDGYWAAKILSAFTDEHLRVAVEQGTVDLAGVGSEIGTLEVSGGVVSAPAGNQV